MSVARPSIVLIDWRAIGSPGVALKRSVTGRKAQQAVERSA